MVEGSKFRSVYNVTAVEGHVGSKSKLESLHADDLSELPVWNPVLVADVFEESSKYGDYLSVIYEDVGKKWHHRQAYFRLSYLKQLLDCFGIVELTSRNQLVGKKLHIQFTRRAGRGQMTGKSFTEVLAHSLNEPPVGDGVGGVVDADSENLPF